MTKEVDTLPELRHVQVETWLLDLKPLDDLGPAHEASCDALQDVAAGLGVRRECLPLPRRKKFIGSGARRHRGDITKHGHHIVLGRVLKKESIQRNNRWLGGSHMNTGCPRDILMTLDKLGYIRDIRLRALNLLPCHTCIHPE